VLVHITIGYGQATIYVTTNQAGMTESVIVGTINVTTNNQAGMTESVIVGGCVRTLLFTITGLSVMVHVHVVLQKLKGVTTLIVVFVIKTRGGDSLGKKE